MADIPSWDQLSHSLDTAKEHPRQTAWDIYHYLNAHHGEMGSEAARTLLAIYLKLDVQTPSTLHSCILSVALKMVEEYRDFRLPNFLQAWGFPEKLSDEDCAPHTGKDGRTYSSLKDRVIKAIATYLLQHPAERKDAIHWLEGTGFAIDIMVAVKVFETKKGNRTLRSAKLISPAGDEMMADSHLLPCKPWEIVNRHFDVLIRTSREGKRYVAAATPASCSVEEAFPTLTGYVEHVDMEHRHIHVYDKFSRHTVAPVTQMQVKVGDFVCFSPVIAREDKFKCAIIHRTLSAEVGLQTFGIRPAEITYIDPKGTYAGWTLCPGEQPIIEAGTTQPCFTSGYIHPDHVCTPRTTSLATGEKVKLVVFLKRGKDGEKHPYVPYYI